MKAIQWLTKVILSTILVTAISLLTTWAIVSVAVQQLLAQYNIKLSSNVLSLPNLLSLVTSKPQAQTPILRRRCRFKIRMPQKINQ